MIFLNFIFIFVVFFILMGYVYGPSDFNFFSSLNEFAHLIYIKKLGWRE